MDGSSTLSWKASPTPSWMAPPTPSWMASPHPLWMAPPTHHTSLQISLILDTPPSQISRSITIQISRIFDLPLSLKKISTSHLSRNRKCVLFFFLSWHNALTIKLVYLPWQINISPVLEHPADVLAKHISMLLRLPLWNHCLWQRPLLLDCHQCSELVKALELCKCLCDLQSFHTQKQMYQVLVWNSGEFVPENDNEKQKSHKMADSSAVNLTTI